MKVLFYFILVVIVLILSGNLYIKYNEYDAKINYEKIFLNNTLNGIYIDTVRKTVPELEKDAFIVSNNSLNDIFPKNIEWEMYGLDYGIRKGDITLISNDNLFSFRITSNGDIKLLCDIKQCIWTDFISKKNILNYINHCWNYVKTI